MPGRILGEVCNDMFGGIVGEILNVLANSIIRVEKEFLMSFRRNIEKKNSRKLWRNSGKNS